MAADPQLRYFSSNEPFTHLQNKVLPLFLGCGGGTCWTRGNVLRER